MAEESNNSVEFIYCACGCGKTLSKYDSRGRIRKYINHHHNRGKNNSGYKGGVIVNGYRVIYVDKGHRLANRYGAVREHRYLFEQYHNCCLLKWSHVHHIDGNKLNNIKENLEGMTSFQHQKHHHQFIDKSNRFCLLCGSKTTYIKKNGIHDWRKYLDGYICLRCAHKQDYKKRKQIE